MISGFSQTNCGITNINPLTSARDAAPLMRPRVYCSTSAAVRNSSPVSLGMIFSNLASLGSSGLPGPTRVSQKEPAIGVPISFSAGAASAPVCAGLYSGCRHCGDTGTSESGRWS